MLMRLAAALIAATLCLASPCLHASNAGGSPAFEAMLRQADLVRSSDPEQFQQLLGQLTSSVEAASNSQREQLAYLRAYQLGFSGRFDLGIAAAKKIFDTTSDVALKFRAGSLMINSYASTREFTEGLRYLDQTLALVDQVQDPDIRHHGWTAASQIYSAVGQYDLARHYAELVLADDPTPRTSCVAGYSRLEAIFYLGRLDSAESSILQAMAQCEAAGEPLAVYFLKSYLARFWATQDDRIRAIGTLEQMLPDVEASNYSQLIAEVHSQLAQWKLEEGMVDDAEGHARVAMERSVGIVHSLPFIQANQILYRIGMSRNDETLALASLRAYTEANEAYLDSVKARELAFQLVKHETQQKTQTIELLNRQNQVLTLEQRIAAKTTQANRLLIALLAVLLASIGYWAFKVKRMQVSFRKLAEIDALTGISNRHHFTRRAAAVLEQCRKANEQVGLVMLDLDHFKSINDQYGHATGDWALREVARVCLEVCRRDDLLGRLGGEEFAFLLVGSDLDASAALARECRLRIAAIDTLASGHEFQITASFGVAGSRSCGHGFDALLAKADDALYQSKRDGRDRVSLHAVPA
ncbi:MAG: hypothetical protein DCF27_02540 [Lysobacteraceae bacterium]|nr:MAG: hypothetical protein DCF27_02540 [Xanthomonadaceae bacterium]